MYIKYTRFHLIGNERCSMNQRIYRRTIALVLPLLIFAGLYYPLFGYAILACMVLAIIISFYNGRYWCGRLCHAGEYKNLGKVVVGDCTKCGKCVSVCPQNVLSL